MLYTCMSYLIWRIYVTSRELLIDRDRNIINALIHRIEAGERAERVSREKTLHTAHPQTNQILI